MHSAHSHCMLQNLSTWNSAVKSPRHCLKISLRLMCYLFVVQIAQSGQWLGCGTDQGISARFPEGEGISPSSQNPEQLRCPSSLLHNAFWGVQLKALLCPLSKFRCMQLYLHDLLQFRCMSQNSPWGLLYLYINCINSPQIKYLLVESNITQRVSA